MYKAGEVLSGRERVKGGGKSGESGWEGLRLRKAGGERLRVGKAGGKGEE